MGSGITRSSCSPLQLFTHIRSQLPDTLFFYIAGSAAPSFILVFINLFICWSKDPSTFCLSRGSQGSLKLSRKNERVLAARGSPHWMRRRGSEPAEMSTYSNSGSPCHPAILLVYNHMFFHSWGFHVKKFCLPLNVSPGGEILQNIKKWSFMAWGRWILLPVKSDDKICLGLWKLGALIVESIAKNG